MNPVPTYQHLPYDDLLIAFIDTNDLSDAQAAHLEECPVCQEELTGIARRYRRMGKMAARLAPAPQRNIRLPQHTVPMARHRFRPLVAAGVTAAVIFLIATFWPRNPADIPIPSLPQTMLSDRKLMQEVDALVDNALPPAVQRLAAVAAPHFDEDLINWIVPSIQEEGDLL